MHKSTGILRRALVFAPALGLLLLLAGCAAQDYPQTTLQPRGDFAHLVDSLFRTTLLWATVVFILVEGVLVYAIFRFRGKPSDAEPSQVHGNTTVEILWTVVPAVILAFIAVPTVQTIFRTSSTPPGEVVEIEVIGHQWWWEYRYPGLKIVTANELHVPVNKTVSLKMTSGDVVHSFWIPQLAAKRDVFPKKYNPLWFKAEVTGDFPGQCAEFCGLQHGRMGLRVLVDSQPVFDAWVKQQQTGSPLVDAGKVPASMSDSAYRATGDSVMLKGKLAFMTGGCIACHAMAGTATAGLTILQGPNLSHVGSRTTIVAGMLKNTPTNLRHWLTDPQAVKEGSLMKLPRPLTEDEITNLVAYLRAHQ